MSEFKTLEVHPCVGCGANSRLVRRELREHGGHTLTFTCPHCSTTETLRAGGDLALSQSAFLQPR
jgi:Zn ribbon nucleic-acid-binding protein